MTRISPSAVIVSMVLAAIAATFLMHLLPGSSQPAPPDTTFRRTQPTQSPAAPVPEPSGDWATDTRSGYRLRLPEGWRFIVKNERLVRGDAVSPDRKAGLQIRIQEPFDPESFDTSLTQITRSFVSDMERHWSGEMTVAAKVTGPIGPSAGVTVIFRFHRGDGSEWFLKHFYFRPDADDQRLIFMQAGCPAAMHAQIEPLFDAMAESLTVLNPR